jgi:hypothetical protein
MDGTAFDALTRALTRWGTRRRVVRLAAGLALGGVAVASSSSIDAKKKRGKKGKKRGRRGPSCPAGYSPCGEQCFDLRDNPQHCGACATVCSPGKDCCGGVCANRLDDDNHCGTCGIVCRGSPTAERPQGGICVNGVCQQCALAGSRQGESPLPCCRGLQLCQDDAGTRNDCISTSQACTL